MFENHFVEKTEELLSDGQLSEWFPLTTITRSSYSNAEIHPLFPCIAPSSLAFS